MKRKSYLLASACILLFIFSCREQEEILQNTTTENKITKNNKNVDIHKITLKSKRDTIVRSEEIRNPIHTPPKK
ncbi:MAG: hypothetical protein Q4G16_08870 [Cruoricaptor ignavus]|nr:hypothetical protein [Cruoricaptor ignavus]